MKVTIKDIAKMAGVSIGTVSRVINNNPKGVSQRRRQEIQRIIDETGYTPNILAQSMITNKTKTIGLLIPDILNPYHQTIAKAIEDYMGKEGYSVFLCNTDYSPIKYVNYIKQMISKNVDGLIVLGYPSQQEELIGKIIKDMKVVVIGGKPNWTNCCKISTESIKTAYELTKYLIACGHQQIAYVAGDRKLFNSLRLEGYKKALKQAGMPFNEKLILNSGYTFEESYKKAKNILDNNQITAVFCFNDVIAQGLYKYCNEVGKKIPEDISIVGVDDIYTSRLLNPPLTTISRPSYEMGEEAAKILIDWIEKDKIRVNRLTFSNTLIIRESVKK